MGLLGAFLSAAGTLALVLFESALAQPDLLRRDLDELVVRDELHRLLQRVADRRDQDDVLVAAGGADVGQLLGLERVHDQVVVAAVNADDLTLVDLVAMLREQLAALLQVEQRVRERLALRVRDQHAVDALTDLALEHRTEVIEDVVHEAGARGERAEVGLESDQPARRNHVVDAHATLAVRMHARELSAALAERLHHRALGALVEVDRERLVRLALLTFDLLDHHARARNRELVPFTAHVLEQHSEVQLAATVDLELV